MSLQRVALASIFVLANLSQDVSGFTGISPLSAQRLAQPAISSKTAIREGSEISASEKAAELKRKAEEAKRKAEELKKVAEAKAAAAMMAVKKANDEGAAAESNNAEAAAKEVIEQESAKMSAKADAVKEARSKATYAVPDDSAIIPINEATIEFTAGVLGGVLGFAVTANPVFAVVAAAAANYISKKDDLGELNELVQSISKASLSTYNWFAKLDAKYMLLGKITESLDSSLENLKKSGGNNVAAIEKIEKALSQTTKQLQELAEEADLLEGSKQALGAVGEIIETGVDKTVDANREYKLTERAAIAARTVAKKTLKKDE